MWNSGSHPWALLQLSPTQTTKFLQVPSPQLSWWHFILQLTKGTNFIRNVHTNISLLYRKPTIWQPWWSHMEGWSMQTTSKSEEIRWRACYKRRSTRMNIQTVQVENTHYHKRLKWGNMRLKAKNTHKLTCHTFISISAEWYLLLCHD